MIELLQFLFFGHIHKYKVVDIKQRVSSYGDIDAIGGEIYILQCNICGKIKQKDIS